MINGKRYLNEEVEAHQNEVCQNDQATLDSQVSSDNGNFG